jgi:hypothetical protein
VWATQFLELSQIASKRTQLTSLNDRVAACRQKIDAIAQNSSKATVVLCPPKFPAGVRAIPFVPTLAGKPYQPDPPDMVDELPMPEDDDAGSEMLLEEELTGSADPAMRAVTLETLVKTRLAFRPEDSLRDEEVPTGLGTFPDSVRSIADGVLFNSTQVPYKDYMALDNLAQAGEEQAEGKDGSQDGDSIGLMPQTLFEGNDLPEAAGFDLSYRPAAPVVAALQLPENMALPNIADVAWQDTGGGTDLSSFLPSALRDPTLSLPMIADYAAPAPALPPPSIEAPAGVAAPPPPPTSAPASAAVPPPPPMQPPPSAAPAPAPAPAPVSQALVVAELAPEGADVSGRSSLLDALRNPENFKRLRKTEEGGDDPNKQPEKKPVAPAAPRKPTNPIEEMMLIAAQRKEALTRGVDSGASKQKRPTLVPVAAKPKALPAIGDKDDKSTDSDLAPPQPAASSSLLPPATSKRSRAASSGSSGENSSMSHGSDESTDDEAEEDEGNPTQLSLADLLARRAGGPPAKPKPASPAPTPALTSKPSMSLFDPTAVHGFRVATASVVSGGARGGDDGADDWDD